MFITRVLNHDIIDVRITETFSTMFINGRFVGSIPASGRVEWDFGLLMLGAYDE